MFSLVLATGLLVRVEVGKVGKTRVFIICGSWFWGLWVDDRSRIGNWAVPDLR